MTVTGSEHWGTQAPCTVYEKRPLKDPKGNVVPGLFVSWIHPEQPGSVQLLYDRDGQGRHRRF